MSNKSSTLSPKYAKKKRRQFVGRITILGTLITIILGSAVYSIRVPALRVVEIKITGVNSVKEDEIKQAIKETLSGNTGFIFPNDSVFWFSNARVKERLLASFPEFSAVESEIEGLNTLAINVTERKPYALWCEGAPLEKDSCYFLDKQGFLFARSPSFSGNIYFYYYGGGMTSATGTPIYKNYLTPGQFEKIDAFMRLAQERGVPVVALESLSGREYEARFTLKTEPVSYGRMLFVEKDSYDKTLENLTTIWKEKKRILSIDLRYGNKVYFKLQ